MSTSNVFHVFGCYGTVTVDIETGNVRNYLCDDTDEPEYADISRLDIRAFEKTFGQRINVGDHLMIMDFNFWSDNGQYFALDCPMTRIHNKDNDCSQPIIVLHAPNMT